MDTRTVEYLMLLGYLYLRHGQGARAVTALEAARIFRRDDRQLGRTLAYAYLSAGRFDDCLKSIDRLGLKDDRHLALIRSRALWGMGREDEARRMMAAVKGDLRSSDGG
ncbi:MAG TPA: hypothetical protein VM452_19900 [Caulifigura sp.]|nr:hypothetical protein [Caulifigura sp.]